MNTVIVYWNATKFTLYENIDDEHLKLKDSFLEIIIEEGRQLIIPWNSINRVEIISTEVDS